MRVSFVTLLLIGCAFAAWFSQNLSAQTWEPDALGTAPRFEMDPEATWGPSTRARGLASRIGIYIDRKALLTLESAPADLLIQNVDSEAESVRAVKAELMFAIRATPLTGTAADRKSVPLKAEFLRNAPRSTFAIREYDLPAKAAVRYKVDLAKWFDFKHPGSYELQVCYAPVQEITTGYGFDKRCALGPEVKTVLHIIPAIQNVRNEAEKGKAKQ